MGSGGVGSVSARAPLPPAHDFLSQLAQENHIVQFYESEEFLADVAAHFIGVGLAAAEPTVVVATRSHQAAFALRLEARGFDLPRLTESGRLVLLDAHETLASLLVDGEIDAARFASIVGGTLDEVSGRACHARMRAYGEMVDLLWAEGNSKAALRLEELWNELGTEHSFSLLCAYDMAHFSDGADGPALERVCGAHTHVVPTESYSQLADPEARLREVTQLQQRGRALENEVVERKRVEEQLRHLLRQRDDFLAIAGHELKTPLTAAQLMMESLLRLSHNGVPDCLPQRLGRAAQSLDRLGKVIEGVLDVTRLTTGCIELAVEDVDLVALTHEVVDSVTPALQQTRCTVTVSGDAEVRGRWDRQRLGQIVAELVSNAAKYSGALPIEVRLERGAERARVVVRDCGVGIAAADQARIFERFERAAVSVQAWGLGLGLWIARQAVEAHGGSIRVESELGAGSSFIVELPYG
jgi:signal transduction histidine kinase